MPRHFEAIAAMALNRVIGAGNKLPWHIPEELKWFKQMTTGQVVIMGRKTFESIIERLGKPLPNRETIIVSRSGFAHPGTRTVRRLDEISLDPADPRRHFITGGAELYTAALPLCSDLYLTLIQREVPGDAFFPLFESDFTLFATLSEAPDFKVLHYRNQRL
jgi:dihydrofolate reductase